MHSNMVGMISRKLAEHFTNEGIIENLIISLMLDSISPHDKETYFTCCKLLVKVLNHYISTQDKFVRIFQEGSYAVLVETEYGWKHIEVKREGYEDSKYVIDHVPIDLPLRFVLEHNLETVIFSSDLYRDFNRPKVDRLYLKNGLIDFFYEAIMHDAETNNYDTDFCKFGSYRNLNFDDAREFLIGEVRKNPSNKINTPLYEIYNSFKFDLFGFESNVRQINFIDSSANADYKHFIKKVGSEVLTYELLFISSDYKYIEPLLLSIDTDLEEMPHDAFENQLYISEKVEYVLNELGIDDLDDDYLTSALMKKYYLIESLSRVVDTHLKYDLFITFLKSHSFSKKIYYNDNLYDKLKEMAKNKSYNILDTEYLPIKMHINDYDNAQYYLARQNSEERKNSFCMMRCLGIPNKARLKKAKNIDIKVNLLVEPYGTEIEF